MVRKPSLSASVSPLALVLVLVATLLSWFSWGPVPTANAAPACVPYPEPRSSWNGEAWDNGTEVGGPSIETEYSWRPGAGWPYPYGPSKTLIKRSGDYVYVYDNEPDGCSALGIWYLYSADGERVVRKGLCRNSHGNNTWARCNYDWPEGRWLVISAGTYDAQSNKYMVNHGGSANVYNGS